MPGPHPTALQLEDGEVVCLDNDDCVVCWDKVAGELYNTGCTVKEFGSMTEVETARVTKRT